MSEEEENIDKPYVLCEKWINGNHNQVIEEIFADPRAILLAAELSLLLADRVEVNAFLEALRERIA